MDPNFMFAARAWVNAGYSIHVKHPLLRMPELVGIEGEGMGASFQSGPLAVVSAVSESIEREHLISQVPIATFMNLQEFLEDPRALAFTRLYSQTASSVEVDLFSGTLPFASVIDVAAQRIVLCPHHFISLRCEPSAEAESRRLLPFLDSSGSAAHSSALESVHGALWEFCERQTWTACWLGGGQVREISFETADLEDLVGNWLSDVISREGYIRLYALEAGLACSVVCATYQTEDQTASIQYSCGVAAAGCSKIAISKAIYELSHCLVTMGMKIRTPGAIGKNELDFNHFQWTERIPFLKRLGTPVSLKELCSSVVQTQAAAWASLFQISQNILLYAGSTAIDLQKSIFISRIVSPDFFIHANPGAPLNIDNSFTDYLGISGMISPELCCQTCLP